MKVKIVVVFAFLLCNVILGQITGIKSEADLKRLGASDSQLNEAKRQYFEAKKVEKPVESKGEVDSSTKQEKLAQIDTLSVNLQSTKKSESDTIYGHSIFRNGSVRIQKSSDRINAPEDYIIGSGDKISVTIWGFSEFSDEYVVDESGNITPKLVGRINLKGKTYKVAKKIMTSRFSKVYDLANSRIAIGVSYSKVVSVNVVGEVVNPGTYSIPSINTAFNFLSVAGGPTLLGTVREIEVRRSGKLVEVLDVYKFMTQPLKSKPVFLEDGDFLVVKARKSIVKVDGEVNRPGVYELKEGENFDDLLSYCGGFSNEADQSKIHLTRTDSDGFVFKTYMVEKGKKIELFNGDKISISRLSSIVKNRITVSGSIRVPGSYEFIEGEKIYDLIKRAKGITPETFLNLAHIRRLKSDFSREIVTINLSKAINNPTGAENIILEDGDEIVLFNKRQFLNEFKVKLTGLVKKPGTYQYLEKLTLEDVVSQGGGFLSDADQSKIEIERVVFDEVGQDSTYIKVIKTSYEAGKNIEILPYDIINVRRYAEFEFQEMIEIIGEVRYPGYYTLINKGDRLLDLISRSGGTTRWAFLKGAYIIRSEVEKGLVILNLEEALEKKDSKYNYVLRPGDKIYIPKNTDLVKLTGELSYTEVEGRSNAVGLNAPYVSNKRASYYIKKFGGGYKKSEAKKTVYVVGYNGHVKQSKFFGLLKPKVNKGDLIVVKMKPKKVKKKDREKIDWDAMIQSITIKLTGLASLWIITQNINL